MGDCAPRRRMHNHISYNICRENEQLYGIKLHNHTMLVLFNLMLTVKPCTKINHFRGCIRNTVKDLSSKCYKC